MLKYDGKEYRNLQEQVLKNKNDIIHIIESSELINDYGLRIVGSVADAADLPDPQTYTGNYGDCYAVGTTSDYNIYIFTRPADGEQYPTWFNLGRFPSPGPQGPQGPQGLEGPQGERGSKWSSSQSNPAINNNLKGDQHLNTNDGSVFQFDGSAWYRTGSLRGPQGIQGPVGPQGAQGVQGPKGDTGAQGPVGPGFEVVAIVASTDLLPDPSTIPDNEAYLVGTEDTGYDLYVQVNNTWVDSGKVSGVEGPQGPAGPEGPQGPQGEQGPIGATGPQGEKGDSATISIGTVTTGDAGTDVIVTNSGTPNNAVFNFTIPKGEKGNSINYMGDWVEENEYHINDVVNSSGNLYICISPINGGFTRPELDSTHWKLFLESSGQKLRWESITPTGLAYKFDADKVLAFKTSTRFNFTYNSLTYNSSLSSLGIMGEFNGLDAILGGDGISYAASGTSIIPIYIKFGLANIPGTGVEQYQIKIFQVIANLFGEFADVTSTVQIPIDPSGSQIDILTY